MEPRLWFVCPDTDVPSGGIRVLYRHVEHLQSAGHAAAVVHERAGFRPTWFTSTAPVAYADDIDAHTHDLVVMPEIFGPHLHAIAPGVRKAVFNQNAYNTFKGYDAPATAFAYRQPEVVGAVVVSDDNAEYLRHAFAGLDVRTVVNAIDPALFRFRPLEEKRVRIAWMPRKNAVDAQQVLNILAARDALDGVDVLALDGLTVAQVADALADALIFLSTGHPEGFGLPAAEAMASGCLTVGYHGMGGREFFTAETGVPIPHGDVVAFARAVEDLLQRHRERPGELAAFAASAAAAIRARYSPERERESVLRAWLGLLHGTAVPVSVA